MKKSLLRPLSLCLAALGAFALGLAAENEVRGPKLELRIDPSPVSEGALPGIVTSYADVVGPVQRAVVSIYSTKIVRERVSNPILQLFGENVPDEERSIPIEGLGSGVIVSPDGYILTNNHVVADADELEVKLPDPDGRKFTAKVVGADPKTDVAVIKIDADHLPTLVLADSDKLRVGDIVFAVGNPLAVGETVTMGIVSAKGRQIGLLNDVGGYENYIQTDAAINMGNSGGALVDAKGRLVGINSAIWSPSRGNVGIGFAVPVNLARSVMESLVETGTVTRGFLGIAIQNVPDDVAEQLGLPKNTVGVAVTSVSPKSPAEKAGLRSNDVIVRVNGKPVTSSDELRLMIAELPPGTRVALDFIRDGKAKSVEVVLGTLRERPNELISGVEATPLSDELRRRLGIDPDVSGLVITKVDDDSPYADQLARDMVIVQINRNPVSDVASAKELLNEPGRNLFLVYSHGGLGYLVLTLK